MPPDEQGSMGQAPEEYEPEVQQPLEAMVEPHVHVDVIVVGLFGQAGGMQVNIGKPLPPHVPEEHTDTWSVHQP